MQKFSKYPRPPLPEKDVYTKVVLIFRTFSLNPESNVRPLPPPLIVTAPEINRPLQKLLVQEKIPEFLNMLHEIKIGKQEQLMI